MHLYTINYEMTKKNIKDMEMYLRTKGHKIRRYKTTLYGLTEKVFIDGEKRYFSLENYGKELLKIYLKEKQIEDYENEIENYIDLGIYD